MKANPFVLATLALLFVLVAAACETTPPDGQAEEEATATAFATLTPSGLAPDGGPVTVEPTVGPTATPMPEEPTPTPTPPGIEMRVPDDATVEASSSAGVVFAFAVPLAQGGLGNVTVSCEPAPGAIFPIGETQVSCTATDGSVTKIEGFTVTVVDTTPPVLTEPLSITLTAAFEAITATARFPSPNGVDIVGGPVTASCDPSSGSPFSIGTTIVTCAAQDPTGNEAVVTFTVEVLPVDAPRETASGCPAFGQSFGSIPPIPMFIKGAVTLDGAPAPDGTVVFVRLTNLTESAALRNCDSAPSTVSNGDYSVIMAPPEVTSAWFSTVRFYVAGRPATVSVSITANNYSGGGSTTINIDAFSP